MIKVYLCDFNESFQSALYDTEDAQGRRIILKV